MSRRTIVRSAALASIVEASTPIRSPLHQAVLGDSARAPSRTPLVNLMRQARARLRQPGVIRHPLGRPQTQKLPERQRVRTAPLDPPLGVDALEVADHVHPEVPARRNRGSAHLRRVVRLAGRLGESVEAGVDQHPLKPIVKDVARRDRGISRHVTTNSPCRPSAIPRTPQIRDRHGISLKDFVNGLLAKCLLRWTPPRASCSKRWIVERSGVLVSCFHQRIPWRGERCEICSHGQDRTRRVGPGDRERLEKLVRDTAAESGVAGAVTVWGAVAVARAGRQERAALAAPLCVGRGQGLVEGRHSPGRQPLPAETIKRVVELTLHETPPDATHWSERTMAATVGIAPSSVHKIWKEHGLKPHLVETFKLSRDPDFVAKVEDVDHPRHRPSRPFAREAVVARYNRSTRIATSTSGRRVPLGRAPCSLRPYRPRHAGMRMTWRRRGVPPPRCWRRCAARRGRRLRVRTCSPPGRRS